jgi:hypothetical protein
VFTSERRREESSASRTNSEVVSIKHLLEEFAGQASLFWIHSVECKTGVHHDEIADFYPFEQSYRNGSLGTPKIDYCAPVGM